MLSPNDLATSGNSLSEVIELLGNVHWNRKTVALNIIDDIDLAVIVLEILGGHERRFTI